MKRKTKEALPVLAVCYDFDRTLSPDDMQAQGYIQSVGLDVANFWKRSNGLALENDMDSNLAYMYLMVREAEGNLILTKKSLAEFGAKVKLYPGVTDWFSRLKEYGRERGVLVEHYIISSGLKEMIEGSAIAREFEMIYASSFYFNERGVAKWPAQAINYTGKTQFLYRISKGVLDINDPGVNDYFPREQIRIPFRNMVYIGDSGTDIPCMKLVTVNGGHSIGVYDKKRGARDRVEQLYRENRIKYITQADYRPGAELDVLLKAIVDKTAAEEVLVRASLKG
ncbi:MAG: haloacid dehalogenase-like hydrolase [Clostridiales bacterium]|nr:haloacid dehalogenase-like hydrolase [Clostridiales bacterium]